MKKPLSFDLQRSAAALPDIEILTHDEDLKDLFRLRRDTYVDEGFLNETDPSYYMDCFDSEPTTLSLAAKLSKKNIGALRFSVSRPHDNAKTLPCGTLDLVRRKRLNSSGILIEFSRFVLSRDVALFARTSISAALVRAGLLVSRVLNADKIILASRPSLVSFYRASMGFEVISSLEKFPPGPGEEPVILMALTLNADRESLFPFFKISQAEISALRRTLFENAHQRHRWLELLGSTESSPA